MMKNLEEQKENGLTYMKMKALQTFKTIKTYIHKILVTVHLCKPTWYEYYGYASLKEYNEALMKQIVAVGRILGDREPKSKYEIVPLGFYPYDKCWNLFQNIPI